MDGQENLLFNKAAFIPMTNAKRTDCLTNASYNDASQKADKRIEKNRLEYAKTYKDASFFFVR